MRELVHVQGGQCGNQIGAKFWEVIAGLSWLSDNVICYQFGFPLLWMRFLVSLLLLSLGHLCGAIRFPGWCRGKCRFVGKVRKKARRRRPPCGLWRRLGRCLGLSFVWYSVHTLLLLLVGFGAPWVRLVLYSGSSLSPSEPGLRTDCSRAQLPCLNSLFRGGGGSGPQGRKRRTKQDPNLLLQALVAAVQQLTGPSGVVAKGKRAKKKKKKEVKQSASSPSSGDLTAFEKVVAGIRSHPSELVKRLEGFLSQIKHPKGAVKTPAPSPVDDGPPKSKTWADVAKKGAKDQLVLAKPCFEPNAVQDFASVQRSLEAGEKPVGNISVAPSLERALEARDLAEAHKLDLKFALLVDVPLEPLPPKVVEVTLPVVSGERKVVFRKLGCVALGSGLPDLPSALVKEVKSVPVQKALATMRVHVPMQFLAKDQWHAWKSKPVALVKEWLGDIPFHSSYGWVETKEKNRSGDFEVFLVGYLKVLSTEVDKVTCLSGKAGVFVHRLAAESAVRPVVDWEPRESHDACHYLRLVSDKAKSIKSVIAWRSGGGSCLGVVRSAATGKPVVGAWRVKAVPLSWTEEDLLQVLSDAGWLDVEVLALPTKKIRPWLIRACAPTIGAVAGIRVGATLLTLERASPRPNGERQSKKIGLHPVAHRTRKMDVARDSSVVGASGGDTVDTQVDDPDEAMESEEASKRLAASPSDQRPKKKAAVGPSPQKLAFDDRFDEVDCGALGACGFNCLAVGAALSRGGVLGDLLPKARSMGITLRTQIAHHLNKHAADYRPFWQVDDKSSEKMEGGPVALDWNSWVESVKRPSRWICGLTLKAASRRLGLKVIVVQRVGDAWGLPTAFGTSSGEVAPIILGLSSTPGEEHYILLRPKRVDDIPVAWLHALQAEEQLLASQSVLRGAGKSEGSGFWLPPETPSLTRKVGKQWLPTETPQSRRSSGATVDKSFKSLPASYVGSSSSSTPCKGSRGVGSDLEVWTCRWCSLEIRADNRALLRRKRSNHLERNHKKRKLGLDGLRQSTVVEASAAIPMDQRAWTCPFCSAGLGTMSRSSLDRAKVHHYKTKHKKRRVSLKTIAKARWNQFKKDPASQPLIRDGRAKWAAKARQKQEVVRSKIDWFPNQHALVLVDVDWSLVPSRGKRARGGDSFYTCSRCRMAAKGSRAPWKNPCRGLTPPISAAIKRWQNFGAANQVKLASAWGVSVESAHLFFGSHRE